MGEWIEIPAHRIYCVRSIELASDFELVKGDLNQHSIYRRRRDGKLFTQPKFVSLTDPFTDRYRLEEM